MTKAPPIDDGLIPYGEYCYHQWAFSNLADREVYVSVETHDHCPYWRKTVHGTIRCERLAVEAIIEWDYSENKELAEAAWGVAGFERIHVKGVSGTYLADEIKICDINLDIPGLDDADDTPTNDVLTWRD